MSQLWYSPKDIQHYTREEVAWMIREAWEGWPPQQTGYFDAHLDVDNGGLAGDLLTAADAALWEIQERMKHSRSPEITEVLVFEVQSELFEGADLWHYDRFKNRLSPPARLMLNYLSGYRRRRETFRRWCWKQDEKRTKTVPVFQPSGTNLTGCGKIKS